MNWKLILLLSLFGLAMGVASLFGLTGRSEPFLWLAIFLLYAVRIAKRADSRFFLHAFLVSLLNGLWISLLHAVFSTTYFNHNPEMLEGFRKLPRFLDVRVMMLVTGLIIGAASGVIAGTLALITARILKKGFAEPIADGNNATSEVS